MICIVPSKENTPSPNSNLVTDGFSAYRVVCWLQWAAAFNAARTLFDALVYTDSFEALGIVAKKRRAI